MKKFLFVLTLSLNCYIINASLPHTDAAASFAQKFKNLAKITPVFDPLTSLNAYPEVVFKKMLYGDLERDTMSQGTLFLADSKNERAQEFDIPRRFAHKKKEVEYFGNDSSPQTSTTYRREDVYVHHYHHDVSPNYSRYQKIKYSNARPYSAREEYYTPPHESNSEWNIYNWWAKLKEKVLPKPPKKKEFLSLSQTLFLTGVGAALIIYFVEKNWPTKSKDRIDNRCRQHSYTS